MARITKRIEEYIRQQIEAKVEAKYAEADKKYTEENDRLHSVQQDKRVELSINTAKFMEAEAKRLGLVLMGMGNEPVKEENIIEHIRSGIGDGRNYYRPISDFKFPEYIEFAKKEHPGRDRRMERERIVNDIILKMELGGKTLEDLNKLIEEAE